MPLNTSVDAILQRMIVDARNLKPDINVSKGSKTYIRFATAASAIYGLYKQKDWTVDQIFLTSMSRESLEQYAADHGYSVEGMTSAELLTFLLNNLRNPASGGKPSDFERWALQASFTGAVATLSPTMVSGDFTGVSAENLLKVHDMDSIGFCVSPTDTEKYLQIDFGSDMELTGIGLGFATLRQATFTLSSSDDGENFTDVATIGAEYWWSIKDFAAASARYWRLKLSSMDELTESWQTETLNAVKIYGIELYQAGETPETASTAHAIANYYGAGTCLVRLLPSSLSARLCKIVEQKCLEEGPVAPREIFVAVPVETELSLEITVSGTLNDESAFRLDITKYFASLDAGEMFIPAQITVYALKYGATNATVQVSKNGGEYVPQSDAMTAGTIERFVLGEVTIV